MKKLLAVFVCLIVALVVLGSLHSGKKMNMQYAAAPTDDNELGATNVCVWGYLLANEKELVGHQDCVTLRIGMDEATVSNAFSVGRLPKTERETTADGTVEYWHYFGPIEHGQWVTLKFEDGVLDAIQQ